MNTNGMQAEAKKVVAAIHLDEVKENLEHVAHEANKELRRAGRTVSRLAGKVEEAAIANPLVTAGVLVGAGALLGALLHSVLRPAPTAGELIIRALKHSASETGDSMRSGYNTVRRAIA